MLNPIGFAADIAENSDSVRLARRWLLQRRRQQAFNGRPGKPEDSCYAFWIVASLQLLGSLHLISNHASIESYALDTENVITGGFGKWPDHGPDLLHSYLCLAGVSLLDASDITRKLRRVFPALNITERAANVVKERHGS